MLKWELVEEVEGYPKEVHIVCPQCGLKQLAEIHFFKGDPFESYICDCAKCGHFITESEWNEAGEK